MRAELAIHTYIMNNETGSYNYSHVPGTLFTYWSPFVRRAKMNVQNSDNDDTVNIVRTVPAQFKNNSHNGKFSTVAAAKLRRKISILSHVVPKRKYYHRPLQMTGRFQLAFATFTLAASQVHTDQQIKSVVLHPFLKCVQRRYGVISYVWRAEKQSNGNVHFHVIWDRYIAWSQLTKLWNYFQNKLGYVDAYQSNQQEFYKNGFRFRSGWTNCSSVTDQRKSYAKGIACNWISPPSVHVRSLDTIHSIAAYLTGYILKPDQSGLINGRLWGCSKNLSNAKGARGFAEGSVGDEIELLIKTPGTKYKSSEHHAAIFYDPQLLFSGLFPLLLASWLEWNTATFPAYRPPGLFNVN